MAEILVLTRHVWAQASGIATTALAQEYVADDSPNDAKVQIMDNLLEGAFITSWSRDQSRMLGIWRNQV